jgi:hypothetical protein
LVSLEAGLGSGCYSAGNFGECLAEGGQHGQDRGKDRIVLEALGGTGLATDAQVVADGFAGQVNGNPPARVEGTHRGVALLKPRAL